MLRVGLTGGLGSGKSTVGALLAAKGAHLLQADEIARQLMQPGEPVFDGIVRQFGAQVLRGDGTLDRKALSQLAFSDGRIEELNAIVHPATIARQGELAAALARAEPHAILVVESALVFETTHAGSLGWRTRFDRIVLVTAPEALKVARFVARAGLAGSAGAEAEARRRLAAQLPDADKAGRSDFILTNDGTLAELEAQVERLWQTLAAMAS